jgi:ribosomal protein S27E
MGSDTLIVTDEKLFALPLSGAQLEAVRCITCGRVLLKVDKHFRGSIEVKCRGCKTMNIIKQ